MTRNILCCDCAETICDRYGVKGPTFEAQAYPASIDGPAEFVRLVPGIASAVYLCDNCGHRISQFERCWAYTIYTAQTPYHPWETEFVLDDDTGSGRSDAQ